VYLHEVAGREPGEQWRAYDREYAALVGQIVRDAIADGTLPADRDPRLTTMTLVGALNWLTRWWDPAGDIGPDVVATQIADVVLAAAPAPRLTPVRTGGVPGE
jgi:hypothetical protein